MAKIFDRATVECNDDGTFSLSVTLPPKEKKNGDGEPAISSYGQDKRATCQTLEEVAGKIRTMSEGGEPEKKKKSDNENLMEYFNGAKYTADKDEDSEKD